MADWIVYRSVGLAALLALIFPSATLAQTPAAGPPGWIEQKGEKGIAYVEPNQKAVIFVSRGKDDPDMHSRDIVEAAFGIPLMKDCPDIEYIRSDNVLGEYGRRLDVGDDVRTCTSLVGRKDGQVVLMLAVGSQQPKIDAGAIALGMLARELGVTAEGKEARYDIKFPTGALAVRKSISSSGNYGVWVAIVRKTVYDPVMAIRMEMGLDYLVLTKGGLFLTQLPGEGGFDDAAIAATFAKDPKAGGRYTRTPGGLSLNYASGDVKIAKLGGDFYMIDGEEYRPKRYFADGTAFSGAYTSSSVTRTGAESFVVGNHDFDFSPNGRFGHGRKVDVAGADFTIVGGAQGRSGTYYVKDSALYLSYDDGGREILSVWQEKVDDAIWIDGEMYKLAGDE